MANPEREREAWRQHFQTVSEGKEAVAPRVWEHIRAKPKQEWMGDAPNDDEIWRCLKRMKAGKAAGDDGFFAEFLMYGGEQLRTIVFDIVRRMGSRGEFGRRQGGGGLAGRMEHRRTDPP